MTKESIERIIRNNRPGIAAHQIWQELQRLERALAEARAAIAKALGK